MDTNNIKLKEALEIDSFLDVTDKNPDKFRHYKLMEFPNQEYGISVTEISKAKISGQEVLRTSNEQIVTYGSKQKITETFENARMSFFNNPNETYSKLLESSMKKFQLNEGEILSGTVKNIKPSIHEGQRKMIDIVMESNGKNLIMKVNEGLKDRFQLGQTVTIKNTAQGLEAQIVPNMVNKLKM